MCASKRGQPAAGLPFRRSAVSEGTGTHEIDWDGGRVLVKTDPAEDESMLSELLGSIEAEDVRMRYSGRCVTSPLKRPLHADRLTARWR